MSSFQPKTLKEVKEDLKDQIRAWKDALKELRDEGKELNRGSGYVHTSSRYETKIVMEAHLEATQRILKMMGKVRKIK